MRPPYVVLLPLKAPESGKSRLRALGDPARSRLALAFALDTLEASLAAAQVTGAVVATDDANAAAEARARGCLVVGDDGDLNAALRGAAAAAAARWPGCLPVALCGDLPALTPADLDDALTQIRLEDSCFVADRHGTGTTLYAAPSGRFAPAFGPDSAASHRRAGARELVGALLTLRLDVDEPGDLAVATALGVGRHTAAVLADVATPEAPAPDMTTVASPEGSPPSIV